MKKSKFTEAQIVFAIKQSETGTRLEEICRQLGIFQAIFFNWKKKIRRHGSYRVTESARVGGRERPAKETGGRSEPGQANAPAGCKKKLYRCLTEKRWPIG